MKPLDRLTRYLALAERATGGTWHVTEREVDIGFTRSIMTTYYGVAGPHVQVSFQGSIDAKADAEFVAASHSDGVWAARALKRAIAVLEKHADPVHGKLFSCREGILARDFLKELNDDPA